MFRGLSWIRTFARMCPSTMDWQATCPPFAGVKRTGPPASPMPVNDIVASTDSRDRPLTLPLSRLDDLGIGGVDIEFLADTLSDLVVDWVQVEVVPYHMPQDGRAVPIYLYSLIQVQHFLLRKSRSVVHLDRDIDQRRRDTGVSDCDFPEGLREMSRTHCLRYTAYGAITDGECQRPDESVRLPREFLLILNVT